MRLCLGHSVQIKTCIDFVQAALQPLSICSVDPGVTIKSGRQVRTIGLGVLNPLGALRHRSSPRSRRKTTPQRFYIPNGFLP
jgi:hypothetical protein